MISSRIQWYILWKWCSIFRRNS